MHVPLRLLMPGYGGGVDENDRQLAVYNPPPPVPVCVSRFSLPEGWEVEEIPRADATRVDRVFSLITLFYLFCLIFLLCLLNWGKLSCNCEIGLT